MPDGDLARTDVPAAFDAAPSAYDRLVNINPGYHRHLHRSVARMRLPGDGSGLRLLDIGCGTGASTAALHAAAPRAEIIAVDASAGMLARAAAKQWPESVRFVHSTVEAMSETGVRGPFDGILASYLIRNVSDPDSVLRDLLWLLRPTGTLAVHEYSVRASLPARLMWHAVCLSIIIPAARLFGGNTELFRYLHRSVAEFDSVPEFNARLSAAGFTGVHNETMSGWQRGLVHTFLADAPEKS